MNKEQAYLKSIDKWDEMTAHGETDLECGLCIYSRDTRRKLKNTDVDECHYCPIGPMDESSCFKEYEIWTSVDHNLGLKK